MYKNHLEELRKQIDTIDSEISTLLEKRFELVEQVAEYKAQFKIHIVDQSREDSVVDNVLSKINNPKYSESVKSVFDYIMDISKVNQKNQIQTIKNMPKKRYAVVGRKLSHTLSPLIHKIFFNKTGIIADYEQIEIEPEELPDLLEDLRNKGINGINITIPYKSEIMKSLEYVSLVASRVGAINTIDISDQFKGYNTDYYGFGRALEYYDFNIEDKTCAVLGSGGSARAVCAYLEDHRASKIVIVSRIPQQASLKFPDHGTMCLNDFTAENFDFIINTTPVGMYPDEQASPISKQQLKGASYVMDLIYNPSQTLLLKYAKELGIPCANGLYMLVAQAISAQEVWQGLTYEQDIINETYEALIKELL